MYYQVGLRRNTDRSYQVGFGSSLYERLFPGIGRARIRLWFLLKSEREDAESLFWDGRVSSFQEERFARLRITVNCCPGGRRELL